jgi:hypothetical protein
MFRKGCVPDLLRGRSRFSAQSVDKSTISGRPKLGKPSRN